MRRLWVLVKGIPEVTIGEPSEREAPGMVGVRDLVGKMMTPRR